MFQKLMNRFSNFEDEDYDDFDFDYTLDQDEPLEHQEESVTMSQDKDQPRVVELKNQNSPQIVVIHPQSMEVAQDVANYVRSGRMVICNFEDVEQRVAQRVVDFMTGAAYSLDGRVHAVSDLIFLVTPRHVTLTDAYDEEDNRSMDYLRRAVSGR